MHKLPVIVSCPIIGAELTREDYPHLPLTPDELANAAAEAVSAGASIIHLHVRDKLGNPSQDKSIFEEVTLKIKEKCQCIVQYSTGGAVGTPLNERIAPLQLKPEMATLSMGTLNFGDGVFVNDLPTIKSIAKSMIDLNVYPEFEIFDTGMLDTALLLTKKNIVPKKHSFDFVLGVPGGMNGNLKSLMHLIESLPKDQQWFVAGVGRHQLPLSLHALAMGGHVRIGIEDNIYFEKGIFAKSSAELINRFVSMTKIVKRPVATLSQTKEILEIE
ncbi:3-keto-5-aminohexanoate cleavage protein [Bacteriovoracaceae bacterium]|nr:3-keto-5-aminohexanoate cleavage protein [Bacteriovoracaceae bacterium]